MPAKNRYEQQFLDALEALFVGARVEGASGYVNLMRIKSRYYTEAVFPQLMRDVDAACRPFDPGFREELFDKLYDFFSRYFSESGSLYFRHTAPHHAIYERVYTDDRDVLLFWKTSMLYYVKTDRLYTSMDVTVEGERFFFDVSGMELKRANEKRALLYDLVRRETDGRLVFAVSYTERGRVTKMEDIARAIKATGIVVDETTLERAFRVFEQQAEVDYFINKDARAFLREQFDLWMYHYLFRGHSDFAATRLAQLQTLQTVAYSIIDYIAQFEDELVKVWNKPKFVLNSHYVITLDKFFLPSPDGSGAGGEVLQRILAHPGMAAQMDEWRALGMLPPDMVSLADLTDLLYAQDLLGAPLYPQYQFLPLDTRHVPDLEPDILALFDDLDQALDGWLVHSENYQALNTMLPKFEGRVKAIYIDPPFNLDSSDQFLYRTNYKDANWATLLENRLFLAWQYLNQQGIIFVRCDYNGNWIIRCLLDSGFGEEYFYNELFINRIKKNVTDKGKRNIPAQIDSLFAYRKSRDAEYANVLKKLDKKKEAYWHAMESAGIPGPRQVIIEGKTYYPTEGSHFKFTQKQTDEMYASGRIRVNPNTDRPQYLVLEKEFVNLDTDWTDIPGYSFSTGFQTENSEILLQRVVDVSSQPKDLVLDFFLGSGTATAVAHKTGRKWLGIEMGEHFYTVVLPRMKRVLFGDQSGISRRVDWQGGGFFKYYDLEQYEDTLRRARYEDHAAPLFAGSLEALTDYVFLRDLKLLDAVTIHVEPPRSVAVDLAKLYPGIDLAETLSCLTGKWIKRVTPEAVEFADGTSASLSDPEWDLVKPLVWW